MSKEEKPKYYQEIESTLSNHNYELRDKIGQGSFASVYKCKNLKYNEIFCVKAIEILEDEKGLITSFDSEFQTLVKIIHPNIITLYDYFQSEHYIYLILEYCPNGSLFDIITKRGEPFSGQELISIFRQVLQAINYIHSIGIAHRDIKPHNILMNSYNRPKLADFGFAQFYKSDFKESHYFNGSFAYMAPELVLKHEYTPTAVDIWALGVTFYQIATGYLPWSGNNVQKEIISGYLFIPSTIDHKISSLIKAMLQYDPNERPSCSNLLEFPLFKKNESKSHSILDIHLKQMSYLKPNLPCSLPSDRKISASSSCFNQIKPKRKNEPQRSVICSRKRTSLAFTFLEEDGHVKNNVSDSILS